MLWKVKYSNILDEEKFIYYPYLDDMGHVTDPYLLWYNEFKAGTILVDGDGKVFIHDGFVNADGYGVIIGEDSDGMIQKSNGIGNWMKEGCWREATSQEVSEFFAKVRKTQKIINY